VNFNKLLKFVKKVLKYSLRNWSTTTYDFIHTKKRNRLTEIWFIHSNLRLLDNSGVGTMADSESKDDNEDAFLANVE